MLFQPDFPEFGWVFTNAQTLPPGQTNTFGTALPVAAATTYATPVVPTNTVQLATTTNVAFDVYGIQLCFNNYAAAAAIRNGRVRIMTSNNNTGPDTNSVIINDLIMGSCGAHSVDFGGIWYYFPLFIGAGTSIWAQAIGSVATTVSATSFGVAIWLFGRPKRPEVARVGRYVDTYGITAASHTGTAVTLGTTAEGNFSQIGGVGITTTRPYWWSQLGFSQNDATQTAAAMHIELAAGVPTQPVTVNKLLIQDQPWRITGGEQATCMLYTRGMAGLNVPVGSTLLGRGQSGAALDTGASIAAYMLGG